MFRQRADVLSGSRGVEIETPRGVQNISSGGAKAIGLIWGLGVMVYPPAEWVVRGPSHRTCLKNQCLKLGFNAIKRDI